ncbi:MAG: hypothetical protein WCF51_06125 [Nitrosomonadaceae bacterium]
MIQGKRSGGPQTSEGKLASSQNSLKLGVYSRKVTLINESDDEFNQLLAQFMGDFAPQDIAESVLVRDLAIITWKRLRLERIERSSLMKKLNEPVTYKEYLSEGIEIEPGAEWATSILDGLTEEMVDYFHEFLEESEPWWNSNQDGHDIKGLPVNYPTLFQWFIIQARAFGLKVSDDPTPEEVCSLVLESKKHDCNIFVDTMRHLLIQRRQSLAWVEKNLEQLKLANIAVKERRLLFEVQQLGAERVNDDLNRSFYKILSELRRHQQWRRKMSIVDVTPSEPKAA